jgi:hypothetical protein
MRLGSLVCDLLISTIYLMHFLYLQRGLESRPCREILYIRCTHIMRVLFCVFCMSIHWRSPPPPLHATDNSNDPLYSFRFKFQIHIHIQVWIRNGVNCRVRIVALLCLFSRNKRNSSRTSIFRLLCIWQNYILIFSS